MAAADRRVPGAWRHWPLVVLIAGLAVTAAGVAATTHVYRESEEQLLEQQVREAGAVLTSSIGRVETAIVDTAVLADATGGDPAVFRAQVTRLVDLSGFVGAQLQHRDGGVIAAGGDPLVGPAEFAPDVERLVADAVREPDTIRLALFEGAGGRRVAFATTSDDPTPFVVYAETPLPERATGLGRSDGPFSDIDYAMYLGEAEDPSVLLTGSTDEAPLTGETRSVTLPFGDRGLTFTGRAARPLSGQFSQRSPLALAAGGLLVSIGAALGTRSVLRRGRAAERLATELAALTHQQRAGIETLRRSLLPRRLVAPPGVEIETGYWPADQEIEISGDFYDAFQVGDGRWAIVIGDVCGKGAEAAALTGLTRHTIRAAARHLRSPADVLRWTHEAIAAYGTATYVTACFAFLEPNGEGLRMSMSLGGHPRPALWRDGTVRLLGERGTLLGMVEPRLTNVVTDLRPGDVLVLYTDGLTDAPTAPLDEEELAAVMTEAIAECEPDQCADAIHGAVHRRRQLGSTDDSALLVVRVPGVAAAPVPVGRAAGPRSVRGEPEGAP